MSNDDPKTPPQEPGATGADSAAATNLPGSDGATEDDTVVLSKKDYAALQAQRDRANNGNSELEATVFRLEAQQEAAAKERIINSYLSENKDKYPDLTADDLAHVEDPEELDNAAAKAQRRLEDVVQKRLLDVQKVDQPIVTPEERADREKRLKASPSKSSFGEMIELRS